MECIKVGIPPRKWIILFLLLCLPGNQLFSDERFSKILKASTQYGKNGTRVLKIAQDTIQRGSYRYVELEDLWAVALKEGKNLFSSSTLWNVTSADQTGDVLGQTTIGPWQLTIKTAQIYGAVHESDFATLALQPEKQAQIAAAFIEDSYTTFGKRTPFAMQRYFWLDGFLQKRIGQGPWHHSVLAKSPLDMPSTGFYAKQLLLGSKYNPHGLLYWLFITGNETAIDEALQAWSDHGFRVNKTDLGFCSCPSDFRDYLAAKLD